MNSGYTIIAEQELAAKEATITAALTRNQYLVQEIAEKDQHIAEKDQRIAELHHQVEKLQRMLFGAKRERFVVPDGQLLMPFATDPDLVTKAVERELQSITYQRQRAQKKHPGRLPLPEHLPIVTIVHEPDEDVSAMTKIGEEVTDELGIEPAKFFIRRHIRPKYISAEDTNVAQHTVIARLQPRVIDKCIASDELLATIIVDKHIAHLPIYRQVQRFSALGVNIPASTVDNWQRLLGFALRPLYAALAVYVSDARYLQVDESGIAVQDRTKKGTTHRGMMWVYHALLAKVVYFDYQRGRGAINCEAILAPFSGYLQTDGYAAYRLHKARSNVIGLACWAHVRRKFFEAQANDPERSATALALIRKLYDVEHLAREQHLTSTERKQLRLEHALPLINTIGAWLVAHLDQTTPKSPIGMAIGYAISLWDELQTYLLDGSLEIDNNLVENAIRPLALGRKNYLFAGSHDAAINIAMYRSFFATCRLSAIDPYAWLLHVLQMLPITPPEEYYTLLPHNIDPILLVQTRAAASQPASTLP